MIGLALSVYLLLGSGGLPLGGFNAVAPAPIAAGVVQSYAVKTGQVSASDNSPSESSESKVSASAIVVLQEASQSDADVSYASDLRVEMTADEHRFVDLTNAERSRAGKSHLSVDNTLVQTARAHSREMYDKDYFAHESPSASLRTPMKRYLAQVRRMPRYAMVGENLFFCTRIDVNRGHQAFMDSERHRDNILNPRYEQMGVGIYKGPDGSFWVTEMFLTTRPEGSVVASGAVLDSPQQGG